MSLSASPPNPSPRRARRKLTPADYQALGAFRQALRRFLVFSETGARTLGLTPQQHQALLAVRAHPGPEAMSVGELARALMVKNHSALGLVERLVERDLLSRASSPDDRRRVLLKLTDIGHRKLEAISRNNLGELKADLPVFTDLLQALEQLDLPAAEVPAILPASAAPAAPRRRAKR